jgi:hypothetical protein
MKTLFIGILIGAGMVAAGYSVYVSRHTVASSRVVTPFDQRLKDTQEEFDARMTKTVNDTTLLPEVRVDAMAAKAKADALFAVDARLGSAESQIYIQQEGEHWQRLKEAMLHPQPKPREPWQVEWKDSSDLSMEKCIDDPRLDPSNRADAVASRQKFDGVFALDTLLGTNETDIFLRQERDRAGRIVAVMEAPKK